MVQKSVFGVSYPSGAGYEEVFFDSEDSASKFVKFRNFKDAEICQYDVFTSDQIDMID